MRKELQPFAHAELGEPLHELARFRLFLIPCAGQAHACQAAVEDFSIPTDHTLQDALLSIVILYAWSEPSVPACKQHLLIWIGRKPGWARASVHRASGAHRAWRHGSTCAPFSPHCRTGSRAGPQSTAEPAEVSLCRAGPCAGPCTWQGCTGIPGPQSSSQELSAGRQPSCALSTEGGACSPSR